MVLASLGVCTYIKVMCTKMGWGAGFNEPSVIRQSTQAPCQGWWTLLQESSQFVVLGHTHAGTSWLRYSGVTGWGDRNIAAERTGSMWPQGFSGVTGYTGECTRMPESLGVSGRKGHCRHSRGHCAFNSQAGLQGSQSMLGTKNTGVTGSTKEPQRMLGTRKCIKVTEDHEKCWSYWNVIGVTEDYED